MVRPATTYSLLNCGHTLLYYRGSLGQIQLQCLRDWRCVDATLLFDRSVRGLTWRQERIEPRTYIRPLVQVYSHNPSRNVLMGHSRAIHRFTRMCIKRPANNHRISVETRAGSISEYKKILFGHVDSSHQEKSWLDKERER